MIELINRDYRDIVRGLPDNHFELAICDPPYFSGPEKRGSYGSNISVTRVKRRKYETTKKTWQVPDIEYYNELVRVSKNQIIWGINYYDFAGLVPGRIVWDKVNGMQYEKMKILCLV